MSAKQTSFGHLPFVLFGIFMACPIFIGLHLDATSVDKILSPEWGLALLFSVAIPHAIGLYLSIREGNTKAGIVIMLFLGFWLLLGVGYLEMSLEGVGKVLLFLEPGIFIVVFTMQAFYRKHPSLRYILLHLGATVVWLWVSKFNEAMAECIPYVVGALGIGVLIVAIIQLQAHLKKQTA